MNHRVITAVAGLVILLGFSNLPVDRASAARTTQPTASQGRLQKLKQALAQLDLSDGQKEQIKQIMADAKTQLQGLRSGGGSVDKTQARSIIKAAVEKIVAVLTPPQKAKLKEILKEHQGKRTAAG